MKKHANVLLIVRRETTTCGDADKLHVELEDCWRHSAKLAISVRSDYRSHVESLLRNWVTHSSKCCQSGFRLGYLLHTHGNDMSGATKTMQISYSSQ